jgi:predicted PurR-regulated permease PerM
MERSAPRFFLLLIAVTTIALALVLRPVAAELLVAGVLAAVLWPVQRWLSARLGGRRGIAAGVLTLGVIVLLIGPLAALVALIIRDGSDGLRFVAETARSEPVRQLIDRLPDSAADVVRDALGRLPRDMGEAVGQAGAHGEQTAAAVTRAVAATGSMLLKATLAMIALFFMLVRGDELVGWLDGVSPLRRGQTRELLSTFKKVSFAVVVATFVTSAVQALAALVGFIIAQVPNPVFFGTVTFFVAFIPAIGAASVSILAAGLLVLTGHPYMAIFLAGWGLVVVGLSDNVVRPMLIRRGMEIHGAIVFFALLGGLAAFGAIGLLIGPLVMSLFLSLLRIYHRDYTPEEPTVPPVPGLRDEGPRADGVS